MKTGNFLLILFIQITIGCGTSKNLTSYRENAQNAEAAGNYAEAVVAWKNYFSQSSPEQGLEGDVYALAAKTAYKASETELAVSWFDQARYRNYADAEMYSILAEIFREQNNLSKELSALEFLVDNYDTKNPEVSSRLFSIYYETDMGMKALDVWEKMPTETKNTEENLEKWFLLNKKLNNEEVCDSVSLVLLEQNPYNMEALNWNAKKIYNQAEEHYQREMAKYEKNKTRRQYRLLLGELDKVTADFKKALEYFEKLWELDSGSRREYASYMANIYVRFNEEQKAVYYRRFAE